MGLLEISELGVSLQIRGLGKIKEFSSLSQKRVTKAVLGALRGVFDISEVEVCCLVTFEQDEWRGVCWIKGLEYPYRVMAE